MMAHRIIYTVLLIIIFKGQCGNALDGQVRAPIPTNTASEEESTTPPSNNPHGHDKPTRSTIITALLKPGGGEVVERTFDRQGRLIGVVLTDGTILRTISHNSKDNSPNLCGHRK